MWILHTNHLLPWDKKHSHALKVPYINYNTYLRNAWQDEIKTRLRVENNFNAKQAT